MLQKHCDKVIGSHRAIFDLNRVLRSARLYASAYLSLIFIDKALVKAAASQDGYALRYASRALRDGTLIVLFLGCFLADFVQLTGPGLYSL